jgi:hypothetical protein
VRIFLDFEFIESGFGKPIHPLSVGMVRDDGEEYYAEYAGAPLFMSNNFVKTHVLPNMKSYNKRWNVLIGEGATQADIIDPLPELLAKPKDKIRSEIIEFVGEKPEFWGYYCDYDWVCLCLTMGIMSQLPNDWPMFCLDLRQEMYMNSITKDSIVVDFPQLDTHNALHDAKWNKQAYDWIVEHYNIPSNEF